MSVTLIPDFDYGLPDHLPLKAFELYELLKVLGRRTGWAFAKIPYLADRLGVSERWLKKLLGMLKARLLVRIVRKSQNYYKVLPPKVFTVMQRKNSLSAEKKNEEPPTQEEVEMASPDIPTELVTVVQCETNEPEREELVRQSLAGEVGEMVARIVNHGFATSSFTKIFAKAQERLKELAVPNWLLLELTTKCWDQKLNQLNC